MKKGVTDIVRQRKTVATFLHLAADLTLFYTLVKKSSNFLYFTLLLNSSAKFLHISLINCLQKSSSLCISKCKAGKTRRNLWTGTLHQGQHTGSTRQSDAAKAKHLPANQTRGDRRDTPEGGSPKRGRQAATKRIEESTNKHTPTPCPGCPAVRRVLNLESLHKTWGSSCTTRPGACRSQATPEMN